MFERNVPCIVVLDEKGLPMSTLSASDVRRFNQTNVDQLLRPLGEFTAGFENLATGPPVCVTAQDGVGEVFSKLQLYGIHQAVVVSIESGAAIGVLDTNQLILPILRQAAARSVFPRTAEGSSHKLAPPAGGEVAARSQVS